MKSALVVPNFVVEEDLLVLHSSISYEVHIASKMQNASLHCNLKPDTTYHMCLLTVSPSSLMTILKLLQATINMIAVTSARKCVELINMYTTM